MKKLNFFTNIFFVVSLMLMLFVILQNLNMIHIIPTTTLEELERFSHYGLITNCIAYIFLSLSIMIRAIIFKLNKTRTKEYCNVIDIKKILKILFVITIIISTMIIVAISLLFTFFALIEIPDIPI